MTRYPIKFGQVKVGTLKYREVLGAEFVTSDHFTYMVNVATNVPFEDNKVKITVGANTYDRIQDCDITDDGTFTVDTTKKIFTAPSGRTFSATTGKIVTAYKKTRVTDLSFTGTASPYQLDSNELEWIQGEIITTGTPANDQVAFYVNGTITNSTATVNWETKTVSFNPDITSGTLTCSAMCKQYTDANGNNVSTPAELTIDKATGTVTFTLEINDTLYFNYTYNKTMYTVNNNTGTIVFVNSMEGSAVTVDYTWIETVLTPVYTVPSSIDPEYRAQVLQIFVVNPTDNDIVLDLYAHSKTTDAANPTPPYSDYLIIKGAEVPAQGSIVLDNLKIILSKEEILAAMGTDLRVTAYGVLEEGI
jgi:hypothetical protein